MSNHMNNELETVYTEPPSRQEQLRTDDWRLLDNGKVIMEAEGYADQPYFLRVSDGALLLVCTTGPLEEGEFGQHIVSMRSTDDGNTWGERVQIEPPDGPEASWAVPLLTPSGRIYVFYTYNRDNVREVPGDRDTYPDGICRRMDTLGYFVYKYSDDHGRTWSTERYEAPMRPFEIDQLNPTGNKVCFFWNVGKPFCHEGTAFIPFIKVGRFGEGMFAVSEGALLASDNILTESDPSAIRFETLPEGEIGIRVPEGESPVSEEHSFVVLSDGAFFCVFRTISGYSAWSISRDAGRSWSAPDFLRYPDQRPVKHPRAATFIWKLSNNRYLYWFHNNPGRAYHDRNPVWCLAAREMDTPAGKTLEFSQPEILLHAPGEINRRTSYPDLMEMPDGSLLISETEKLVARIHPVPADFVQRICGQWDTPPLPDKTDLLWSWQRTSDGKAKEAMPPFPLLYNRWAKKRQDLHHGLSLLMTIRGGALQAGILLDNRDEAGRGFILELTDVLTVRLALNDGRAATCWESTLRLENENTIQTVGVILDGSAQIITGIVNGQFDDGGKKRPYGWGLLHPSLQSIGGGPRDVVYPWHQGVENSNLSLAEQVTHCHIYSRTLLTAETIAVLKRLEADVRCC